MNGTTLIRTTVAPTAVACALCVLAGSAGCVGWHHNYPPIEGATLAVNNPNAPPVDELMVLSLRWLVDKYPPQTAGPEIAGEKRFAINVPKGVRKSVYEMTAQRVSDAAAPLTADNHAQLPVYHIQQIWVRERAAKVTVLRPRQELGRDPRGQPVYEGITLHIEGGFQPWRVVRWQTWEVGVIQTPELYFCPAEEWPNKRLVEKAPAPPPPVLAAPVGDATGPG